MSSAPEAPRWRQESRSRRLVSVTIRARSWRRISHSRAASADATSAESPRSETSRATQVGACTPLVIDPIGTSEVSNPGHRPANISLLTSPCSTDTPLTRWASRMPITAMLNMCGSPPG